MDVQEVNKLFDELLDIIPEGKELEKIANSKFKNHFFPAPYKLGIAETKLNLVKKMKEIINRL